MTRIMACKHVDVEGIFARFSILCSPGFSRLLTFERAPPSHAIPVRVQGGLHAML